MRKYKREVKDLIEKIEILKKCDTVRLALFDGEYPYIIPLNFGFEFKNDALILYFHCAKEGKKLDLIKNNNKAAFECDCLHKLITAETACGYSMDYESICGVGDIEIIEGDEKKVALNIIMKHYSEKDNYVFDNKIIEITQIIRLTVKDYTAKRLKH